MGLSGSALMQVNEAVALLETLAPARLEQIREGLSESNRATFDAGLTLGEGEESQAAPDPSVALALAEVALAALEEAIARTEPALAKARARLKLVVRWRIIAQIFTVIGSSVVIGTAVLGEARWQLVAACLTLGASILTLLADQGERLLGGKTATAGEAFDFLSSAVFPAKQLRGEISVLMRSHPQTSEIAPRVGQANLLCEKINSWLPRLD